jgi:hypothetical protein
VAEFVGVGDASIQSDAPPQRMPPAKLTILRIIQVWLFWDTILEYNPLDAVSAAYDTFNLALEGKELQKAHLEQVLDTKKHEFQLRIENEVLQKGNFTVQDEFDVSRFVPEFEQRFLSLATEKDFDLIWLRTDDQFHVYARDKLGQSAGFQSVVARELQNSFESSTVVAISNKAGRGRKERACGQFQFYETKDRSDAVPPFWTKYVSLSAGKRLLQALQKQTKDNPALERSLSCEIWKYRQEKHRKSPLFAFVSRGNCSSLNKQDMTDLLGVGASGLDEQIHKSTSGTQVVSFPIARGKPIENNRKVKKSESSCSLEERWTRPFLENAPEGARILIVLVSGRRKENIIEFSPLEDSEHEDKMESEATPVVVKLHKSLKILSRWKRMGSDKAVYVNENSVPASVIPLFERKKQLFCCCANSLEVRGGGIRAEGLTLLPPGKMFLVLALVTFDLFPLHSTRSWEKDSIIYEAMNWAMEGQDKSQITEEILKDKSRRLELAVNFHNSCSNLGDELMCYSNKVRNLCEIFDGLDGFESRPWDSLGDNPFTYDNLELLRHERSLTSSTSLRPRMLSTTRSSDPAMKLPSTPKDQNVSDTTPQRKLWSFKKKTSFASSEGESSNGARDYQTPNNQDNGDDVAKPKSSKKKNKGKKNGKQQPSMTPASGATPANGPAETSPSATATPNGDKHAKRKARREMRKSAAAQNGFDQPNVTDDTTTTPNNMGESSDVENIAPSTPATKTTAQPAPTSNKKKKTKASASKKKASAVNHQPPTLTLVAREFSSEDLELSRNLFSMNPSTTTAATSDKELPTTNLLAILVRTYCDLLLQRELTAGDRHHFEGQRLVTLSPSHWLVFTTPADQDGKVWFYAEFINTVVPLLPLEGRNKKLLPRFMKRQHKRPMAMRDAMNCLPSWFTAKLNAKAVIAKPGARNVIMFESLDVALRVEASFWLERQFRTSAKHWYDQSMEEMVNTLIAFYEKRNIGSSLDSTEIPDVDDDEEDDDDASS